MLFLILLFVFKKICKYIYIVSFIYTIYILFNNETYKSSYILIIYAYYIPIIFFIVNLEIIDNEDSKFNFISSVCNRNKDNSINISYDISVKKKKTKIFNL